MLHAFDCGCMSYSDFGFVATLGSRTHFSIADYGHFIGIMQCCYQGNFSDLPSRDLHVLMGAFLDQFVAYCTAHFGVPTQAQTPVPTDENAGADVATPEADRLLRMMDVIMNGGMEQG